MSVLVDTDIWSEMLRKRTGEWSRQVLTLMHLIDEGETGIVVIGAVRQEVLSGVRERSQFERMRDLLAEFPDRPVGTTEYVLAAEFFNTCRSRSVQGSNTDFLICACSASWGVPILTKDADFALYAQHVPVQLYQG